MAGLPEDCKVLVFCAHPDDDTFGAGAAISEMARRGCEVVCAYLSSSPRGVARDIPDEEKRLMRKKEGEASCRVMGSRPVFLALDRPRLKDDEGALREIRALIDQERPDVVFNLPENDAHPTHRMASKLVLRAMGSHPVSQVWFYETWTPLERPNFAHYYGAKELERKREAMMEHESQMERNDLVAAFEGLNRFRAIMMREPLKGFGGEHRDLGGYAEAFLVREPRDLSRRGA